MTFKSVFQFKTWLTLLGVIFTMSLFQNCSKANFSAASGSSVNSDSEVHPDGSCDPELHQLTVPFKILFVVDMSGSNFSSPGTDVDKSLRGGSIQTFLNDYQSKTNFAWGFIGFQGTTAMAFINNGMQSSPRFSDSVSDMQTAIDTFYSTIDDDKTPYKAALTMAKQLIMSDSASASANTKYAIVFLSDGMPTDYSNDASGDAQLDSDVTSLVNVLPGRISFNTIYYGPTDVDASTRLQNMASAGSGQFLDTNNNPTGKSFYISDVINIPGVTCN